MTKTKSLFVTVGVAALLFAAASPASANCNPGKTMGTLSDQRPYSYFYMTGAVMDTPEVIGRFWQAGGRNVANEGTATAAMWLLPFGPDHVIYMFLGDENVFGCPSGELITLIQSPASDGRGSYFMVDRVAEQFVSSMSFDLTETTTSGFHMKLLPQPYVTVVSRFGSVVTMSVTLQDVSSSFYGVSGALASDTITGIRLMWTVTAAPLGPTPLATGWTYTNQRVVGAAGGAIDGFTFDTSTLTSGQSLYLAAQLEFDNGAVLGDYVGVPTRIFQGLAIPPVKEKKPKKH